MPQAPVQTQSTKESIVELLKEVREIASERPLTIKKLQIVRTTSQTLSAKFSNAVRNRITTRKYLFVRFAG